MPHDDLIQSERPFVGQRHSSTELLPGCQTFERELLALVQDEEDATVPYRDIVMDAHVSAVHLGS